MKICNYLIHGVLCAIFGINLCFSEENDSCFIVPEHRLAMNQMPWIPELLRIALGIDYAHYSFFVYVVQSSSQGQFIVDQTPLLTTEDLLSARHQDGSLHLIIRRNAVRRLNRKCASSSPLQFILIFRNNIYFAPFAIISGDPDDGGNAFTLGYPSWIPKEILQWPLPVTPPQK